MIKQGGIAVLSAIFFLLSATSHSPARQGEKKPEQKAILAVAFGTSDPEARKTFLRIDETMRNAFPAMEIRWAYTSKTIRGKLTREGMVMDSPEIAMTKLMNEGFTRVAVLSLHVIPGQDYNELYRNAQTFGQMKGGFEKVLVATPLLATPQDMITVATALLKNIPGRKPSDGVLFMGHGSKRHPGDGIYQDMEQVLQSLDSRAFVGTTVGKLNFENILPKLRDRNLDKVYLVPVMAVAGEHARRDMAGAQPESWKSVLTANGFQCEVVLKGAADIPEILEVWMEHLRETLSIL